MIPITDGALEIVRKWWSEAGQGAAMPIAATFTPAVLARLDAAEAEITRLKAIMLDEDLIWDILLDSMDADWSALVGARAVVAAFQKEIDGE